MHYIFFNRLSFYFLLLFFATSQEEEGIRDLPDSEFITVAVLGDLVFDPRKATFLCCARPKKFWGPSYVNTPGFVFIRK